MNKYKYIVMVVTFDKVGRESITAEFSGKLHDSKRSAIQELRLAQAVCFERPFDSAYLREVEA